MGRAARTKQAARKAEGLSAKPEGQRTPGPSGPRSVALAPETQRLLTARHEAAHVVIAHTQGIQVQRVTLDQAEAISGALPGDTGRA